MGKGNFATVYSSIVYSAIWKDGPLFYDYNEKKYIRKSDKKVTLRFFNNSQNIFYKLYTEVPGKLFTCGISQNPTTKNFVIVLEEQYFLKYCNTCRMHNICGNQKVDDLVQEMQLKINNYNDIVFEWIPYDQFNEIEEIGKGDFAIIFLAVKRYSINKNKDFYYDNIYGISQNPCTKDYIIVFENEFCSKCAKSSYNWCKLCKINYLKESFTSWTNENENIDSLIQKMQIKVDEFIEKNQYYEFDYIVFEWIPYNQFSNIKEICKHNFTTLYSAKWKSGPLHYYKVKKEWIKESDKKVILKYLNCSQNFIDEFLNQAKIIQ
ncbi:unnamed protein product [Rhizophagus irregularis]|nr:unnamed protein product [Rhizophagus irregularis]